MARFLNLMQDRAPAPAVGLDRRDAIRDNRERGPSFGAALLLASAALRFLSDLRVLGQPRRRSRPTALKVGFAFAAGTVIGLAAPPMIRAMLRAPSKDRVAMDEAIDRDSADSFPASDAPSRWR